MIFANKNSSLIEQWQLVSHSSPKLSIFDIPTPFLKKIKLYCNLERVDLFEHNWD